MSIFDRLLGKDGVPDTGDDPRVAPTSGLRSPQGWVDRAHDWPPERARRYEDFFPEPYNAVFELADLGEALEFCRDEAKSGGRALEVFGQDSRERLESYAFAVQALNLGQEAVPHFKGTLGHLAHVVLEHLDRIPEVAGYKLVGSYLRSIGEDMRDGGDADLGPLGNKLLAELSRVRKGREMVPTPSEAPRQGTTASLADQFRARYESAPPEAIEEAEDLPPGDLTTDAVFRALLEECIKDGKFSRAETRAICQVRDMLGISLKRHSAILKLVQADYKAGKISGDEDMNPLVFFENCCRIALADGVVNRPEKALLETLGQYLHITKEEWSEIRKRLVQKS